MRSCEWSNQGDQEGREGRREEEGDREEGDRERAAVRCRKFRK